NEDHARGARAFDGAKNFGGIAGVFEDHRRAEKQRNEEHHERAENMAKRNQRNKAKRVKKPFVFQITPHATLDGFEVGEKISVAEDDPARLGGGAGGKKDFRDVLAG